MSAHSSAQETRTPFGVLVISALMLGLLVVAGCSTSSPSGPDSPPFASTPTELYMSFVPRYSSDPPGTVYVYVDGKRVRSWTHLSTGEMGLVVVDSLVRTMTYESTGGPGHEYSIHGSPTGRTFTCLGGTYDASSDGEYIYAWDLHDAQLVRCDLEWSSPEVLFSLPFDEYSMAYMGITYDLISETVWLSSWSEADFHRLDNYSLDGALLGSIDLQGGYGAGLAMDYRDSTLWYYDWSDERYEKYSPTSGTMLGVMDGMYRIYGAEFAPPD